MMSNVFGVLLDPPPLNPKIGHHLWTFPQTIVLNLHILGHPKAELLQLNRTQFPSLGILLVKKMENEKTETTFIISVLKVVY